MPTAILCSPPQPDHSYCIDAHEHPHCTYISFCRLDGPQHSFETLNRCMREELGCYNKHSLFPGINKDDNPPLFSLALNSFPPKRSAISKRSPQRSLTDAAIALYDEMTTIVTEAPGSPPGLTGSKSSTSSSFHSSSLSGGDAILSDISHFEDIGLEEEHRSVNNQKLYGMDKPLRPLPRPVSANGAIGNAISVTTMRDLTNAGNKPSYPRIQGPSKGYNASHPLSLLNGVGPPMRRGLRSPSTPSLAITAMSNRNRSRSPSPNILSHSPKPLLSPASPRRPGLAPLPSAKNLPVRRGSWQPSRKSIKELENEYDDLDEDLPEDASLWNVPLSPRPPTERTPITPAISPRASPRTSPERPSTLRTSTGAPSTKTPLTAPPLNASSPLSHSLDSPPTSPKKPRALMRGASTGAIPDNIGFSSGRTKSWNAALSELSEEAKSLTEVFENHAILSEQKQEEAVQNGSTTPRPSMERLARAKTSNIELPPLRMNNVMIDPLPVSKEKEKVLSRTRPSWLPPKSQKEERKHLKEYQRMMEFSLEAGMSFFLIV